MFTVHVFICLSRTVLFSYGQGQAGQSFATLAQFEPAWQNYYCRSEATTVDAEVFSSRLEVSMASETNCKSSWAACIVWQTFRSSRMRPLLVHYPRANEHECPSTAIRDIPQYTLLSVHTGYFLAVTMTAAKRNIITAQLHSSTRV